MKKKRKGERGKGIDVKQEVELDLEAAEAAWPYFEVFNDSFKGYSSLGPGPVEVSSTLNVFTNIRKDLWRSLSWNTFPLITHY